MGLIYFALGIAMVVILHFSLERTAALPDAKRAKFFRVLTIIALIIAVAILIRLGLPFFAWLLGGLTVFVTLIRRLMVFYPIARFLHGHYRQRTGQKHQERARSSVGSTMTRREAAEILNVPVDASPQLIREAYYRLMQQLHPDHGGSVGLAKKLNEARDVLLGK